MGQVESTGEAAGIGWCLWIVFQGDDTVFTCAHDSSDDSTRIYLSYNIGNKNIPLDRQNVSNFSNIPACCLVLLFFFLLLFWLNYSSSHTATSLTVMPFLTDVNLEFFSVIV